MQTIRIFQPEPAQDNICYPLNKTIILNDVKRKQDDMCAMRYPRSSLLFPPLDLDDIHPGRGVGMPVLLSLHADLHPGQPLILQHLVDPPTSFWIRIQHMPYDGPTFSWNETIEWRRAGLMGPRLGFDEVLLGVGGE